MQHNPNNITYHAERGLDSVLALNKVLRQTYMLLSANILFSALCAYIGILLKVPNLGILSFFVVIGLSFAISRYRNSGVGIVLLFALTGFLGLMLSSTLGQLIGIGAGATIVKALVGAAVIFLSLSAYVLLSKRDFTFLGGFLFVGLIIALLAALGFALFGMSAMQVAMSAVFLLIFSGYVLYDTSNIVHGYETNYITATLNLFLNIINIFISLINIFLASDN